MGSRSIGSNYDKARVAWESAHDHPQSLVHTHAVEAVVLLSPIVVALSALAHVQVVSRDNADCMWDTHDFLEMRLAENGIVDLDSDGFSHCSKQQ